MDDRRGGEGALGRGGFQATLPIRRHGMETKTPATFGNVAAEGSEILVINSAASQRRLLIAGFRRSAKFEFRDPQCRTPVNLHIFNDHRIVLFSTTFARQLFVSGD